MIKKVSRDHENYEVTNNGNDICIYDGSTGSRYKESSF